MLVSSTGSHYKQSSNTSYSRSTQPLAMWQDDHNIHPKLIQPKPRTKSVNLNHAMHDMFGISKAKVGQWLGVIQALAKRQLGDGYMKAR